MTKAAQGDRSVWMQAAIAASTVTAKSVITSVGLFCFRRIDCSMVGLRAKGGSSAEAKCCAGSEWDRHGLQTAPKVSQLPFYSVEQVFAVIFAVNLVVIYLRG